LFVLGLTWLPLLIITLFEGRAFGGVREPFLDDLNAQIRLLVALPLLVIAEPLIHCRSAYVVKPFLDRAIVAPRDAARFHQCIELAERRRTSRVSAIILALGCTVLAGWIWHQSWSIRGGVWYIEHESSGTADLTIGGWWYVFVSLNVFRFVMFRWYYRVLVWYGFLWQVSRFDLDLNPLHPDRSGGLGFLALSVPVLGVGFLGQTTALAARIGGRILHDGETLDQFIAEMSIAPVLLTLLSVLPLTFFMVQLIRMRLRGAVDYGGFATKYTDAFRARWLRGDRTPTDGLLGTSDIQSLADLSNSYQLVTSVRILPVSFSVIFVHSLLLAAPFLPLALTKIPLDELIRRVAEKVI
jgi:hypothetical protein